MTTTKAFYHSTATAPAYAQEKISRTHKVITSKNNQLISDKVATFLRISAKPTPYLVMDLDIVEAQYQALANAMPFAGIYYAIKANPAPEILQLLNDHGSNFDVASVNEIKQCLAAGVAPQKLSFGNPIKKAMDIAWAYQAGVDLFAFDSLAELEKLAVCAPRARVFCRLLMETESAEWPLSRKFGCTPEMAAELLIRAQQLGLTPYGVSFHVGSQQTDPTQWHAPIGKVARLFVELAHEGVELQMINLRGGFPARYHAEVPVLEIYAQRITNALHDYFGKILPTVILEPGRSMVAEAGVLQSEVILISRKSHDDPKRWVYLDVGKFGGLAETMDEVIKYRLRVPGDHQKMGPVILAGPTCDSADVLYDKANYELPLDLRSGDKIQFLSTGAYTNTYASVGFNGFEPMTTYCI